MKQILNNKKIIICLIGIIAVSVGIVAAILVDFDKKTTQTGSQKLENDTKNETEQVVVFINDLADTSTLTEEELKKQNEKELEEIKKKEDKKKENKSKDTDKMTTVVPKKKYYIKVNYNAQVVNIYTYDKDGKYTVPVKAFVCSTGTYTPTSGVYKIPTKIGWCKMIGDVYGQYTTQIVGNILFHSVPYLERNKHSLEYWEYDKLGERVSLGCIRLTTRDAKWIYDNVAVGTSVEFYSSSNPGPLGKTTAPKISNAPEYLRGWDPTDPDPNNPWLTYVPEEDDDTANDEETNTNTGNSGSAENGEIPGGDTAGNENTQNGETPGGNTEDSENKENEETSGGDTVGNENTENGETLGGNTEDSENKENGETPGGNTAGGENTENEGTAGENAENSGNNENKETAEENSPEIEDTEKEEIPENDDNLEDELNKNI